MNPVSTHTSKPASGGVSPGVLSCGDCIEVMCEMDADSVHAIVCDPPYGIEFMQKSWDAPHKMWDKRDMTAGENEGVKTFLRAGKNLSGYVAGYSYQQWTTAWATEALRVLKPGGSMLVFGGDRTHHRMMCGIEDAGFIIKTSIMWLFGSGFPKAQSLDKIIDKRAGAEREVVGKSPHGFGHNTGPTLTHELDAHPDITLPATDLARKWDGYKIGGIKPAFEIIAWAVKPPEGSWTDNVLKYGVGAVNVDECRVGHNDTDLQSQTGHKGQKFGSREHEFTPREYTTKGRFPANLILSHHADCVKVGTKRVKGGDPKRFHKTSGGCFLASDPSNTVVTTADPDGMETVEAWECSPECPARLLDEQSGVTISSGGGMKDFGNSDLFYGDKSKNLTDSSGLGDKGGASRFFYSSKATDRDHYNDHPTLKPTPVIEWLIRLVTRPGQTVLDPFAGSGTTGVAAVQSGREYILCEQDEHYVEIIEKRLSEVQMGMF